MKLNYKSPPHVISDLHAIAPPGILQRGAGGYQYFLPATPSAQVKSIALPLSLIHKLETSSLALGRFETFFEKIPNPDLFIRAYGVQEANCSGRIEGTQTTVEDAFVREKEVMLEKRDDWAELQAYIKAQESAFSSELPLSNRLIKQTHAQLLDQVRGQDKLPGEFRRSQNWIGGSRPDNACFVPPHHDFVEPLMADLELFMQEDVHPAPHLIKAAIIHSQFETIHPFLDGNGRLGRMLITLYLMEKQLLKRPILYLSKFFERQRNAYYDALDGVRKSQEGYLRWLAFFLDAVQHTAGDGLQMTHQLVGFQTRLREQTLPKHFGRQTPKALQLLDHLFAEVRVSAKQVRQRLGFSSQVTQSLLKRFVEIGVLREITKQKRNRVFVFTAYLDILRGDEAGEKEGGGE